MDMDQAAEQRREEIEQIRNGSVDDLLQNLEEGLIATDVIITGYQLADQFTDATSIVFAGVCQLRANVENAIEWIEANIKEEEPDDFENLDDDESL